MIKRSWRFRFSRHGNSLATNFSPSIAREVLDYVLRDMTHPEGGFFSAEDADSLLAHGRPEHAEGAYYVWSRQEIVEVLGAEDARIFCRHYGVEETGNAPAGSDPHGEFRGKNILIEKQEVATTARILNLTAENVSAVARRCRAESFSIGARSVRVRTWTTRFSRLGTVWRFRPLPNAVRP